MPETTVEPSSLRDWSDATLDSLQWQNDGPHLAFSLTPANGPSRTFICQWVDHLTINLTTENLPLRPLTREVDAMHLPSGRIQVTLDFAHQGEISFQCEAIVADISPSP